MQAATKFGARVWILCGAILLCGTHHAVADATLTGVVSGTWSDPVLSGNIIDGATGVPIFMDNSATAACDIAGCPNGVGGPFGADTLVWGTNPTSSTVNINGHFFSDVPLNTVFDAATITYFNGTSNTTTLIFGATLHLRFLAPFDEVAPDVADPFDIPIDIVTTANTGTAAQNADWIGPFGTPAPLTFNVLEGENSQAELYGMFVEDPQFQPELLVSLDANGFIGNGLPVGVPEPGGWPILLIGAAAAAGANVRRRKTA
ncbi:MAG TPA: choice-of-anchor K domain-containing protein [Alphaproteobacteria bacterium]|nr:choice-of-anchor K domain-containing protein [Alphaproteobacteria bacterium]